MTYKAGVVGAAGFAGIELVRLLARHPEFELVAATSDAVTITNTKRKISYTFSPLPIEQENDTERPAI